MFEKVKSHVKKHQVVYAASASAAVSAGIVTSVFLIGGRHLPIRNVDVLIKNDQTAVGWKINQTIVTFVERSTPSKPVHLKGTNLYFASMSEAARATGHSVSQISKNISGIMPDLKGDIFELLEKAV